MGLLDKYIGKVADHIGTTAGRNFSTLVDSVARTGEGGANVVGGAGQSLFGFGNYIGKVTAVGGSYVAQPFIGSDAAEDYREKVTNMDTGIGGYSTDASDNIIGGATRAGTGAVMAADGALGAVTSPFLLTFDMITPGLEVTDVPDNARAAFDGETDLAPVSIGGMQVTGSWKKDILHNGRKLALDQWYRQVKGRSHSDTDDPANFEVELRAILAAKEKERVESLRSGTDYEEITITDIDGSERTLFVMPDVSADLEAGGDLTREKFTTFYGALESLRRQFAETYGGNYGTPNAENSQKWISRAAREMRDSTTSMDSLRRTLSLAGDTV